MGVFILGAAVVIELALAIFSLLSKSHPTRARNILRIVGFPVFTGLCLLSIVDWSPRYYGLAALLLLLAVIGTAGLLRGREDNKGFKAGRVILRTAGMALLFFTVSLPALIFPQYPPIRPGGPYAVASTTYAYTDTARVETYAGTGEYRSLNVQFWYPAEAEGAYPLIVFSHGGNGIRTSNLTLFNELASHGYVIASIDHTYQSLFTTGQDGQTILVDRGYMQELLAEDPVASRQQSFEYYQKWMGIRTGDINFVIDRILAEARRPDAGPVYRLVDPARIGVMGHSLGGAAALGIGRMRDDVGAVLALDGPFLCDITGVKDSEFVITARPYPAPLLNVYSDDLWPHLAERPRYVQYEQNYRLLSSADPDVYNVHLNGTGHFSLTDLALESPWIARTLNEQKTTVDIRVTLERINRLALGFFDDYLKGRGEFAPAEAY